MPSNRLEEIREREAKATPGPWIADMLDIYDGNGDIVAYDEGVLQGVNGDFITHSRQDIPYLLQRLELAEKVVEATRAEQDAFLGRKPGITLMTLKSTQEATLSAVTAYDAFLSASNPETGGGKVDA